MMCIPKGLQNVDLFFETGALFLWACEMVAERRDDFLIATYLSQARLCHLIMIWNDGDGALDWG